MMRVVRSRNRRFERQRLISEMQMAESENGESAPRRLHSVTNDRFPDPKDLPTQDAVVREMAWMMK